MSFHSRSASLLTCSGGGGINNCPKSLCQERARAETSQARAKTPQCRSRVDGRPTGPAQRQSLRNERLTKPPMIPPFKTSLHDETYCVHVCVRVRECVLCIQLWILYCEQRMPEYSFTIKSMHTGRISALYYVCKKTTKADKHSVIISMKKNGVLAHRR